MTKELTTIKDYEEEIKYSTDMIGFITEHLEQNGEGYSVEDQQEMREEMRSLKEDIKVFKKRIKELKEDK